MFSRFLVVSFVAVVGLTLAGCGGLMGSLGSSSSPGGGASSQGDRGLIAYRTAHARGTSSSAVANPNRQPRTIEPSRKYSFDNAIPFFPRNAGSLVTSDFGWRNLWGRADFHCGVDVIADIGTPVYAVTGGEITFTRSAGHRGGVVIYDSGRQYTYWHMIPGRNITEGRRVRAGQRIGTLADWGGNTHIHYGLYLTGSDRSPNARETTNCVDPLELARSGLF